MPPIVKGILVVATSIALATGTLALVFALLFDAAVAGALVGLIGGALYGLLAAFMQSYDLSQPKHWGLLALDLTWSLPNTLFGLVFGNAIYPFFGKLDLGQSRGETWISYSGSIHGVYQTLGTINIGGAGAHERVHLMQARVFGPAYLPLFGLNYVINGLVQGLWTITIGALLKALRMRDTAWFRPPDRSAVRGFFGWIYYATLFELWAYGTET
jgi:hypothetical protein